jgi:oligopeptide transport system substrate-binding protein
MNLLTNGLKAGLLAMAVSATLAWSGAALADTIHRGNGAEPGTLDPQLSTGVPEGNILRDTLEGLVIEAADGSLLPGAAESWTISDDGTVYTFKMRKDGKWSNGDPVTAQDFVFSLTRGVDPATASEYSFILFPIKNAEEINSGTVTDMSQLGVKAVDDTTLEITLKASTPYFLGMLTHSMASPVHKATFEKFGDQFTRAENSVTNGPYKMVEWVPQSHIKLVRSESHPDFDSIKTDTVFFYPTEDSGTEMQRYRSGELHMTSTVGADQVDFAMQNLKDEYKITPYLGTYYYMFNAKVEAMTNAKARRALSLAIDRAAITEKILKAGQIPAYGWVPPGIMGYKQQSMPEASMSQAEREALAKKLWTESGVSSKTIEILYNTSESHKKIAVAIPSMWKKALGLEVSLVNKEWKTYLEDRNQAAFEVVRAGWIGDYNDANTFSELFISESGMNTGGFTNVRYDELVGKASVTADQAARGAMLEEAERILLGEMPIMPIYFYVSQAMISPKLQGWAPNILDHHPSKFMSLAN